MSRVVRKARVFWPLVLVLVLGDCATKRWASAELVEHVPRPVVGDVVRFTLSHNTGAATGITLGEYSRVGFSVLTLGALVVLFGLYRQARPDDTRTIVAVGAVTGGALGNLIDRLRWDRGVVDFIDVGFGASRFWIFNLADVGVTCGALALAFLLWKSPPGEGEAGEAATS
jgi:signal peptidase II